jgi:hypothetical protein
MTVFQVYIEKKEVTQSRRSAVFDLVAMGLVNLEGCAYPERNDAPAFQKDFDIARMSVFGEQQVDKAYDDFPPHDGHVFAVEYLPGH